MQASQTPLNDPVDRSYFTHKTTGSLQHPTRLGPSPSPSQSPVSEREAARSRLPRTSSLLPPPHFVSSANHSLVTSSPGPSAGALPEQIDNTSSPIYLPESSQSPATNSTLVVNRWSTSTGSNRSNSIPRPAAPRSDRRSSSVDTTFLLTSSPSSSKRRSRKLQKSRRPSDYSDLVSYNTATNSSPVELRVDHRPILDLPTLGTLSSLSRDYSTALDHRQTAQQSSHYLPQSLTDMNTTGSPQRPLGTALSDTMPYDEQEQESYGPPGHARNRSGKGSSDSAKSRSHKPSQKATLSRALQKANTAVQLDNHQDIAGARQAYGEACDLLQQVLQRTSDQEDKRKLEAIVSTKFCLPAPSRGMRGLRVLQIGEPILTANTSSNAHIPAALKN